MNKEFGIAFNILEPDGKLRIGALCWMTMTNPGSGNNRFRAIGTSFGGRRINKWVNAAHCHNFRAKWIPPSPLRRFISCPRGTRDEMEQMATMMNKRAQELRDEHPNRVVRTT